MVLVGVFVLLLQGIVGVVAVIDGVVVEFKEVGVFVLLQGVIE